VGGWWAAVARGRLPGVFWAAAPPPGAPRLMGQTAPARGLALVRVTYPGEPEQRA